MQTYRIIISVVIIIHHLFIFQQDPITQKVIASNETPVNDTVPEDDRILMNKICLYGQINNIVNPICENFDLFYQHKKIVTDRLPSEKFPKAWEIIIGITYAESHIGINYARDNVGGKCEGRNNWGGIKTLITDDGKRINIRKLTGFDYQKNKDQYNCYLFPYVDMEEFFMSISNTMRYGYSSCFKGTKEPVEHCISRYYVGKKGPVKTSWVNRVSLFSK